MARWKSYIADLIPSWGGSRDTALSFEKCKRIADSVDWLCAASPESPRPTRGNGARSLYTYLQRREICEEASFYLRTCVPSTNLRLGSAALFGVDGMEYMSGDRDLEHFPHGFLVIGDYTDNGETSLLDLKNGFVYLLDIGYFLGGDRVEKVPKDDVMPDEILMKQADRFFPDIEQFLHYTVEQVRTGIVFSLWDSVMAPSEPVPGEYFLSEEKRAAYFAENLRTPVDATLLRDEAGRTLLEVARERQKPLLTAMLEEYWQDPLRFREGAGRV